jgi:hypothetical protein
MKTKFKLGQVVRFKNYKRHLEEKEAYFIVIQEDNTSKEMVLFTLNSNRIYISGTTIIPEFPEEDLELVSLRPSDLMFQKITIKQIGTALVSDAEFEFTSIIEHRLMGPLYIEMNYENDN